jgi:hypothetical protein
VQLGPIALLAHAVENGRASTVGLRLAEPEPPRNWGERGKRLWSRVQKLLG